MLRQSGAGLGAQHTHRLPPTAPLSRPADRHYLLANAVALTAESTASVVEFAANCLSHLGTRPRRHEQRNQRSDAYSDC